MVRTRTDKWKVQILHPNGNYAEPQVVGKPVRNPEVQGLPEIEIPVKKDGKWDDDVWEEQEMNVWFKGGRQNIEQFERAEQREESTILIGRGGVELRNTVEDEYIQENSTIVADNLITQNTSYTANVDNVNATEQTNETIQTVDTTSEFINATTIPEDVPLEARNGRLEMLQTAWVYDVGLSEGSFSKTDANFNDGSGSGIGPNGLIGDEIGFSFTPEYNIPEDNAKLYFRVELEDSTGDGEWNDGPPMTARLGTTSISFADRWGSSENPPEWDTIISNNTDTLFEGTSYDASLELDGSTDSTYDTYWVDMIVVVDARYGYTSPNDFDNTLNSSSGYLDDPALYPSQLTFDFDSVSPASTVTGARVESNWNDLSGGQYVALSNDGGVTYSTANNTDTHETDFGDDGSSVTFQVGMSNYGTRTNQTPLQGFNGQAISSYTLKADLSNVPLVINETFNDRVDASLDKVAQTGDFTWEFQIADDGTKSVEFATEESRVVNSDVDINSYNIKKDSARVLDRVIIFGAAKTKYSEDVTANHDTPVSLANDYLVADKERVQPDDLSTTYERGTDYEMGYNDGTLTALSTGNITDGESLEVRYDWNIRSVADNGASNPRTETIELPGVTTQQLADIIAIRFLQTLSEEDKTVDVTVPSEIEDFSAINAVVFEELPITDIVQLKSIEGTPDEIVIRGGTRESLSSLTKEIQSQVKVISRKA